MYSVKASSPDLDRLARRLETSHPVFEHNYRRLLNESVIKLEGLVQDRTSVGATGELRNSIFGDVRGAAAGLYGVVATPSLYGEPAEIGTAPHWPPVDALKLWARRVLGDERLGFVVARKIARKGTKGKFMFREGLKAGKGAVQGYVDRAAERIIAELGFK